MQASSRREHRRRVCMRHPIHIDNRRHAAIAEKHLCQLRHNSDLAEAVVLRAQHEKRRRNILQAEGAVERVRRDIEVPQVRRQGAQAQRARQRIAIQPQTREGCRQPAEIRAPRETVAADAEPLKSPRQRREIESPVEFVHASVKALEAARQNARLDSPGEPGIENVETFQFCGKEGKGKKS